MKLVKSLVFKRDLNHIFGSVFFIHTNFKPNWTTVALNKMMGKGPLHDVAGSHAPQEYNKIDLCTVS